LIIDKLKVHKVYKSREAESKRPYRFLTLWTFKPISVR